jgi:dTDP-4-dehydrorhamnose reductase
VRALITGGAGQLAGDLTNLLGESARAYSHTELDITDPFALERAFEDTDPEIVFNCAAFHNVDLCEREPHTAWQVNVNAVRELARRNVPLVHFSTNYVFDGCREEPYAEHHLPAPRSIYALTKLAGEHAALAYGHDSLVVRTAGLYGLNGSASKGGNFVQRMIARARHQGRLSVVADQRLQPTFTAHLARAVIDAVHAHVTGLLHLTATGACSWHELTLAIVEHAALEVPVEPISTTIPPGAAQRPLNGVLSRPRADSLGLSPLPSWREALVHYMNRAHLSGSPAAAVPRSANGSRRVAVDTSPAG